MIRAAEAAAFQRAVKATKAACLAVAKADPDDLDRPIDGIRRRINKVEVEDE
jgi:hypothetical protein